MKLADCRRLVVGSVLGAILMSVGCGGADAKRERASQEPAPSGGLAAAVHAPRGRDLEKTDVCQLLPGVEVARAFAGTLRRTSGNSTAVAADCTYTIELRTPKTFIVYLYPPDQFAMLKEWSERAEPVAGLGDGAFVERDNGWYELKVLRKDDVTVDARADTLEQAKALAGLALARL